MHLFRAQATFLDLNQLPTSWEWCFCKPVHRVRARDGPPGTNLGPFKVKPSSHHAHVTRWVQCDVTKSVQCGLMGGKVCSGIFSTGFVLYPGQVRVVQVRQQCSYHTPVHYLYSQQLVRNKNGLYISWNATSRVHSVGQRRLVSKFMWELVVFQVFMNDGC